MPIGAITAEMSPEAILASIEDYHGMIVDLDGAQSIPPQAFGDARWALARKMNVAGLRPGDRVIVAVGNGPLFLATWAAILMRGGSPVLVHWETPSAELKRIAQRFHIRFVATDAQGESDLAGVGAAVSAFDGGAWVRLVWADFGAAAVPADGAYRSLPGVPLHPTSGTTGQPKMAVRPAACAMAETRHYVETIGIDHQDRILALAPMSHAYGHGWYVITPMVTGADIVTLRRFNAKAVFQACHDYGITILPAVGAILDTLLFGAGERLHDPSRRIFTGGAPVSERTAANFLKISGTRPRPLYGATETGGIAVARADDRNAVRGCVGLPFAHVEVEIRPPQDGSQLENGLGLVHVRSPSVMAGYLVDERLDTSALVDGWFSTGDLGWLDQRGALHLRGRQAEVINVSGMKVLPSEVEEVISSLGGVTEVKVYSGQTQAGAYHVRAAVAAGEGVDVERIKAHCEEHLVYYKRPARIILMDALPRTSAGKIARDLLP
jgi:acyl-CoA synthetase (AMP-forming)/AMP-acid ligase II